MTREPNNLNVILNPETIPPINPTTLNDANAINLRVVDIGSALGYLFSKLPVTIPLSIQALRPALVQYAALLHRISMMQGTLNTMANVIFSPTDGFVHFGSTIQVQKANPGDLKIKAQKHRYNCLKAVIGPLPVLPPLVESKVVDLLKNDYLLPSKNQTEDHTNYKNALQQWDGHPVGQLKFETRKARFWAHEDYLAWLYLQLLRSLLKSSSGTRPLNVVSADSDTDARGWHAQIVNLLMTGSPPSAKPLAQRIPLEGEGGPDGAAAGGELPHIVAVRDYLSVLLAPATVFKYIFESLNLQTTLTLYGHCAETYPMIHCERFETHFLSPPTYFPEFAMR